MLWVVPGQEAKFLAPLDVRDIPGVGKVTEQNLHALGIRKVGDLARFDDSASSKNASENGGWLSPANRAGKMPAAGSTTKSAADSDAKSISHEHTYNEDTANVEQLESTLMRLSEMVGRRLREAGLHARTIQLKLRYKDFTTITRAHSLAHPPPNSIPKSSSRSGCCFARTGRREFRCGCWASTFPVSKLPQVRETFWRTIAASAGNRPFPPLTACGTSSGSQSVHLAGGMKGSFRERTHESLPERKPKN